MTDHSGVERRPPAATPPRRDWRCPACGPLQGLVFGDAVEIRNKLDACYVVRGEVLTICRKCRRPVRYVSPGLPVNAGEEAP